MSIIRTSDYLSIEKLKTGSTLRATCASALPVSCSAILQWLASATKSFGSAPVSSLSKVHESFRSLVPVVPSSKGQLSPCQRGSGGKRSWLQTPEMATGSSLGIRGEKRLVSGKVRVTCVPFRAG